MKPTLEITRHKRGMTVRLIVEIDGKQITIATEFFADPGKVGRWADRRFGKFAASQNRKAGIA